MGQYANVTDRGPRDTLLRKPDVKKTRGSYIDHVPSIEKRFNQRRDYNQKHSARRKQHRILIKLVSDTAFVRP